MFLDIQDGDYTINARMISDMQRVSENEITVWMASGREYTIEGEDIPNLLELLGKMNAEWSGAA